MLIFIFNFACSLIFLNWIWHLCFKTIFIRMAQLVFHFQCHHYFQFLTLIWNLMEYQIFQVNFKILKFNLIAMRPLKFKFSFALNLNNRWQFSFSLWKCFLVNCNFRLTLSYKARVYNPIMECFSVKLSKSVSLK